MTLLTNIGVLARCMATGMQHEVSAIADAALVWRGDTIVWVGAQRDLPSLYDADETWDAEQRLVIPGLIDSHTHLAFGGYRAAEFEQRIHGVSYADIARAGGGIASTVAATRKASAEELTAKAGRVLAAMARLGVTTVECKSGYGLDHATELKLLEVYRALQKQQPLTLVPTYLGAHIVPPEHRASREYYIAQLCQSFIPEVAARKLARFCDVFVEDGAFAPHEARDILQAGRAHGLLPKVHADQLSDGGGARLAAEVGALSADHLEFVSPEGRVALREANVVATLLPIASLYTFQPPAAGRALLDAGVRVAVATDYNPGTAPSYQLPMALMLACTLNRLTPDEALMAGTCVAAAALDESERRGSLAVGKAADFAILDAPDVAHWLYHFEPDACVMTVKAGRKIFERDAAQAR